ncbi:MAG: hypothetical protein J6W37_10240 [Bacteroidales bacterium]|nr:hypothetical protein [Bacteroidales bacterium]
MNEKATTPYPERTEDVIILVCEPATEYGKPLEKIATLKILKKGLRKYGT